MQLVNMIGDINTNIYKNRQEYRSYTTVTYESI